MTAVEKYIKGLKNYKELGMSIDSAILLAETVLLPLEKQQIINAFDDGRTWNNSWTGETYQKELFENPNTLGR